MSDQQPVEDKEAIAARLMEIAKKRELTNEERIALRETAILNFPFLEEPSIRREDWYDDDGR